MLFKQCLNINKCISMIISKLKNFDYTIKEMKFHVNKSKCNQCCSQMRNKSILEYIELKSIIQSKLYKFQRIIDLKVLYLKLYAMF